MNEKIFLDTFNIKTYPELIIDYLKNNNINCNINNLRSFYSELLESISVDVKESYLNRILKYLSSKEESTILIIEDINDKIYEKELITFFNKLHLLIQQNPEYSYFYKNILKQCSFIFFDEDELKEINEIYSQNKYDLLLYKLFLHACKNYKTNTPKIVAERLLYEALVLNATTKLKSTFMKASADLGNDIACLIYGNIITPDFADKARYFLKGKNNPFNLWLLGFVIENFQLTQEQFEVFKKELKNILDEGNKYLNNVEVINENNNYHKDCTITALKIYSYLANDMNLSKALCSVGKFFLEEKVAIVKNNKIDKEESIKIGIAYSRKAVRLGNIHAMQNIGTYFYYNDQKANVNYKELLHIGANAKDLLSSIYFSKILIDENKIDEAEEYLKFLAKENNSESLYKLGKIYESKMEIDEAIKYYEKAINNNYYLASIDLAKIYFSKYMNDISSSNAKNGYLLLAINILEKYYNRYNENEKKEADFLLKNFKSLL